MIQLRYLSQTLALLGLIAPSWGSAENSDYHDDIVQFALHTQFPLGVNFQIQKRYQITKWERRPELVVVGAEGEINEIHDYLQEAGEIIEENLGLSPIVSRHISAPDIVFRTYRTSEDNIQKVLTHVLHSYFESEASELSLFSKIPQFEEFGSGCTTLFFDRMTDLRKSDPFVVVMLDLDTYHDQTLRGCIHEELGHAMTFFQDIPVSFEYSGRTLQFSTLFQIGDESFNSFSDGDLRMMRLLALPEIYNGMQTSDANYIIARHLGV